MVDDGHKSLSDQSKVGCYHLNTHKNHMTCLICWIWSKNVFSSVMLQLIFNRANRFSPKYTIRRLSPIQFHVLNLIKRFNSLIKLFWMRELEFWNSLYCSEWFRNRFQSKLFVEAKLSEQLASPVMLCVCIFVGFMDLPSRYYRQIQRIHISGKYVTVQKFQIITSDMCTVYHTNG